MSQIFISQAFIARVYPEILLVIVGNTTNLKINKSPCDQIEKKHSNFLQNTWVKYYFPSIGSYFFRVSMSSSSLFPYNKAVKLGKCCLVFLAAANVLQSHYRLRMTHKFLLLCKRCFDETFKSELNVQG